MKYIEYRLIKNFKPVFFVWRICRWGITVGEIEQLQGYTEALVSDEEWFFEISKFQTRKQDSKRNLKLMFSTQGEFVFLTVLFKSETDKFRQSKNTTNKWLEIKTEY